MGLQGLLVLGLPAPVVPHSASLSPATATRVLSTLVPVSAPPTSLGECLFSISLVLVPLAVRFSVGSGCARRRSVSTYAAILVLFRRKETFKSHELSIQTVPTSTLCFNFLPIFPGLRGNSLHTKQS